MNSLWASVSRSTNYPVRSKVKKTEFRIDISDARHYRDTLYWVRKRLIRAFHETDDMSLRGTINKHGPVIDELIEELGGRVSRA